MSRRPRRTHSAAFKAKVALAAVRGLELAACQDWPAGTGDRFFVRRAQQGRPAERKAMIDRSHDLPIRRQAELVSISRGSAY